MPPIRRSSSRSASRGRITWTSSTPTASPPTSSTRLIVTGTATLFALLVGVPAGYGIARMKAHRSAVVILIARITPGLSYLIPLFLLFQWLGLLGTLVPQIIIHLVVTVPIVIWIMIGYFETTPMELEEAAVIDGATRWQVFRHVALPIAKPGIAVAFILAVIFSWNNFVFGIVLAGRETRTLPSRSTT